VVSLSFSSSEVPPRRKPNANPGETIKPFSFPKSKRKDGPSKEPNPKSSVSSLWEKRILPSK